jgi:hypothetical protein
MKNLTFRRQFILCNKDLNIIQNWKLINLSRNPGNYKLYIHPDLEMVQVTNDRFELILLGYIIDPYKPDSSSSVILDRLASIKDFDGIITATNTLSGRFAVVYNDFNSVKIVHDATGLREVYYYQSNDITACGSTSKILADYLNIPMDDDKEIVKFFNSPELNDRERRWIGIRTIFKGVLHLLPNHYLDLITGKTTRFWPTEARKEVNLREATAIMSGILTGTFEAASKRFALHQGLTGGWDTRVLLAAAQKYRNNIHFFFIRGFKSDASLPNSGDYTISKSIAEKYNFPLDVVLLNNDEIDAEFKNIYFQNNILARPKLLAVYYDAYQKKLNNTVTVAGTGSNEILRLMSGLNRNVTDGRKIAGLFRYGNYEYVIQSINEWLKENISLKDTNYKIIDLFNWEQFFGNWGPLSVSEQDIVREELRPFNNRLLISTYLSLKDKFRYRDYPLGHVHIINQLWPDLMKFEIDLKRTTQKKLLRFLGLEIFADKIYQRLKHLI